MSRITPIIFIVFGVFAIISNAAPFYRPLPQFLEKTVNKVLMKQLDERFGAGHFPTTTAQTTATTITTPAKTRTFSSDLQDIMGMLCHEDVRKCSSKKMAKFLSLIKRLQKFSRLIRNDRKRTRNNWTKNLEQDIFQPQQLKQQLQLSQLPQKQEHSTQILKTLWECPVLKMLRNAAQRNWPNF